MPAGRPPFSSASTSSFSQTAPGNTVGKPSDGAEKKSRVELLRARLQQKRQPKDAAPASVPAESSDQQTGEAVVGAGVPEAVAEVSCAKGSTADAPSNEHPPLALPEPDGPPTVFGPAGAVQYKVRGSDSSPAPDAMQIPMDGSNGLHAEAAPTEVNEAPPAEIETVPVEAQQPSRVLDRNSAAQSKAHAKRQTVVAETQRQSHVFESPTSIAHSKVNSTEQTPELPEAAEPAKRPKRYSPRRQEGAVREDARTPEKTSENLEGLPSALGKFLADEAKLGALAALRDAVLASGAKKEAPAAREHTRTIRGRGVARYGNDVNSNKTREVVATPMESIMVDHEEAEVSSAETSLGEELDKKSEELKQKLLSSGLCKRAEAAAVERSDDVLPPPPQVPPLPQQARKLKKVRTRRLKRQVSVDEENVEKAAPEAEESEPARKVIIGAEKPLPGAHTRAKAAPRVGAKRPAALVMSPERSLRPPSPVAPSEPQQSPASEACSRENSPQPCEREESAPEVKKKKKAAKVKVKVKRKKKDTAKEKRVKPPKEQDILSEPCQEPPEPCRSRKRSSSAPPKRSPSPRPQRSSGARLRSKSRSRKASSIMRKPSPSPKRKRANSEHRKKKSPSMEKWRRSQTPHRRRSPSRKHRKSPSRKKQSPRKQSPSRHQKPRSPSRRRKQSPSRNRKRSLERQRPRSRSHQCRRSRSRRQRPRSRSQQRKRSRSRKLHRTPSRRRSPSRRRVPSRRRSPSRRRKQSPSHHRKPVAERPRSRSAKPVCRRSRSYRNRMQSANQHHRRSFSNARRRQNNWSAAPSARREATPHRDRMPNRNDRRSPSVHDFGFVQAPISSPPPASMMVPHQAEPERSPVAMAVPRIVEQESAPPPPAMFPPEPPAFLLAAPTVVPPTAVPPTMLVPPPLPVPDATAVPVATAPLNAVAPASNVNTVVESADAEVRFQPGDVVKLVGLVKNANLNSQRGTVLPDEGGTGGPAVPGTVKVKLDLGPEVAVKPHNIQHFVEEAAPAVLPPQPVIV